MALTVHRARVAMASWFEARLVGDDPEHLDAVAGAVLEEIKRRERLLSRFDPASEIARLNREAAQGPVRVDVELMAVLLDCRRWAERTGGAFDPCAPTARFLDAVELNEPGRTVRFVDETARIDLGGYGKGFALDAVRPTLESFGVRSALIHGGTSSVLAIGRDENDRAWRVGIRDPFVEADDAPEVDRLSLSDCGLSCSSAFSPGSDRSDLIDPSTGQAVEVPASVVVVAPTATEAEVLSTALLAMGRDRAGRFVSEDRGVSDRCRVGWIERTNDRTNVNWWTSNAEVAP